MTESQELALATAFLLLEEAFDHVLIAVRDEDKKGALIQPDCEISWVGGLPSAVYLANQSLKKLDYSRNGRRVPSVRKAIMDEVMKAASRSKAAG